MKEYMTTIALNLQMDSISEDELDKLVEEYEPWHCAIWAPAGWVEVCTTSTLEEIPSIINKAQKHGIKSMYIEETTIETQ